MDELNRITGEIVDAAMYVHSKLGPRLLESVYEAILARQLEKRGLKVERRKSIFFEFEGMKFEEGFRAEMVIENFVIVELKSVEKISLVHSKQLLTYLKLMNLKIGLLINFG